MKKNEQFAVQSKDLNSKAKAKEHYFAGLIGAFLFSLAGGAVWYILYQLGFIAGISGIIGVICAIKGYSLFGRKESVKGVITAVIVSIIVIVAAWYLCLATDVHKANIEWFEQGMLGYKPSFIESVQDAYLYLEDAEVARGYLGDLALGLIFCVIGGFSAVAQAISRAKQVNKEEISVEVEEPKAE